MGPVWELSVAKGGLQGCSFCEGDSNKSPNWLSTDSKICYFQEGISNIQIPLHFGHVGAIWCLLGPISEHLQYNLQELAKRERRRIGASSQLEKFDGITFCSLL